MNGLSDISKDYYTKPLNNLVGFNQIPQNKFVDNRTTSVGEPVIDTRSQSDKDYDNIMRRQGLIDLSLDFAIPGGQLVSRGLSTGAGLGLSGLNSLTALRATVAGPKIVDVGRREAMQLAGAGLAGGVIASSPVINLAAKGLGLSDNLVTAGLNNTISKAPISLANIRAKKEIFDRGLQKYYTKQDGTLGTGKLESLQKLEKNADDLLKKHDPELGAWMKKNNDIDNPAWDDAYEQMHMLRKNNPDLDDAYKNIDAQKYQIRRISKKLDAKESKAIYSDVPRLSPKELTSEIKILKDEIVRKTKNGRVMPVLKKKSTEKKISQMEKQLNELSKTGKYGK